MGTGTNSTDYSCTATHDALDSDPEALNHCQRLTETLFQNATLTEMWDEFGIVGNLVVCALNLIGTHRLSTVDSLLEG